MRRSYADRLASKLMGVSHSMARRIYDYSRDCGWNPAGREAGVSAASPSQEQRQPLAGDGKVLVKKPPSDACRRPDLIHTEFRLRNMCHRFAARGQASHPG